MAAGAPALTGNHVFISEARGDKDEGQRSPYSCLCSKQSRLVSKPMKKKSKAEPVGVHENLKRRAIASSSTASALDSKTLPKRGQEKADIHLSISNKYPCASLQEELISWHCNQRRIGLSNRNSRISNPGSDIPVGNLIVLWLPKTSFRRTEQLASSFCAVQVALPTWIHQHIKRNKLGKKIESGLGIFLKWKRKLVALLPINGFSTKSLEVGTVIGRNAT
ncbi:uncharacterized protein AAG666_001479 [Megaptera novaeangliae]